MVKIKYKFRNIVIIAENNSDFIRLQQTLLDASLHWYSNAKCLLYRHETSGYYYVDLLDNEFGMGEVSEIERVVLRPETDSRVYDISDIESKKSIIRNGSI